MPAQCLGCLGYGDMLGPESPRKKRDLPCENAWNTSAQMAFFAGIIVEEISRSNCQIPSHTSQNSTFVQGGPLL